MLRKVNQLKRKQLVVTLLSGLSFLVLGCHVTASADANQDPTIANVVFKPTSELNLTNYVYDTVDPKSTRFHQYLTQMSLPKSLANLTTILPVFKSI